MALIVTPGDAGADSYPTVAAFKLYANAIGFDYSAYTDTQIEQSARRATQWIDVTYSSRFPGTATDFDQALEWPRSGVVYREADVADNEIPWQIVRATCEAMFRDLASPGALAPDLERGGAIKSIKAGSVAIDYASTAPPGTTFSVIDGLLAGLLVVAESGGYTARAVRA